MSSSRVQHGAKSLLQNWIRHTTNHNRLLEEAEMWQIHKRMKREGSSPENNDKRERKREETFKDSKIERSFLYDDRREVNGVTGAHHSRRKRAHMDEESHGHGAGSPDQKPSTYWQRQLLRAENDDADRWGHAGFKELYPGDFGTDGSEDEKSKAKTAKTEKPKNGRSKSSHKRKKAKRKHKEKSKGRKKHKNKSLNVTESESDNDSFSSVKKSKREFKKEKSRSEKYYDGVKARTSSRRRKRDVKSLSSGSETSSSESSDEKSRRKSDKRKRLKTKMDSEVKHHSDSFSDTDSDHEDVGWKKRRRKW